MQDRDSAASQHCGKGDAEVGARLVPCDHCDGERTEIVVGNIQLRTADLLFDVRCDVCQRPLRPEADGRCAPCILHVADWRMVAEARGREAAEAAATWATDGNVDSAHYRRILERIEQGDDVADVLPGMPNLSGEWAGDPTPASLVRDIAGENFTDDAIGVLSDELAQAWEDGVAERFETACAENLRAAIAD